MELIDLGPLGTDVPPSVPSWDTLILSPKWREVVRCLVPEGIPTDVQALGLGKFQLLAGRRNVIVSAPTNSGKTLLGYLVLLDALNQGRRALLLEPLRAIAQEKFSELTAKAKALEPILGRQIEVVISTGDYRIDEELMEAPPPSHGQLVIATPERLEAILRNPEYQTWVDSLGAVCVDEAHLISSPRRGPSLEFVLTTLLQSANPPRVALLSATFQITDSALRWLDPCDFVHSAIRTPSVQRFVARLDAAEEANDFICNHAAEVLKEPANSLLVFVYRTSDANTLAKRITDQLGPRSGARGAQAYHSRMPLDRRESVRSAYLAGESRCVVASTALAAGVNLPTTHLIVRDLSFFGSGPVPIDQLIQMSGRAGRGQTQGHVMFVHRPNDLRKPEELIQELREARLPGLVSSFTLRPSGRHQNGDNSNTPRAAELILSLLARAGDSGYTEEKLRSFVAHSLAGQDLVAEVKPALQWLGDSSRLLAHKRDDGAFIATSLGLASSRSSLPLGFAAGFGQLIRDLLSLAGDHDVLPAWSPLDHLLVVELLAERTYSIRRFSADLREQLEVWAESGSNPKSILYNTWIRGDATHSKAIELMGSLGTPLGERQSSKSDEAWKRSHEAYL